MSRRNINRVLNCGRHKDVTQPSTCLPLECVYTGPVRPVGYHSFYYTHEEGLKDTDNSLCWLRASHVLKSPPFNFPAVKNTISDQHR